MATIYKSKVSKIKNLNHKANSYDIVFKLKLEELSNGKRKYLIVSKQSGQINGICLKELLEK